MSAPTAPKIKKYIADSTSIYIEWDQSSGQFVVQWKNPADGAQNFLDPTNNYTIPNLIPGLTYPVRVALYVSFDEVYWSDYVYITTGVPGAPTGLTATSYENAQSTLSWTAPTSDGGSPITNYIVQYGTDPNFATYITLTPNPTSVSATITGLTNRTLYYFRVIAQNANGYGPFSATANATPSTVPGAPTGLTATSNENAQSTLSWTAPISDGGLPITGYVVQYGTDPTFTTYNTLSSSIPGSTVSGLTNGTPYYFRVAAINANPSSPGSPSASANATPSTVPDPPTGLTATSNENAQSTLSWAAPDDGGLPITRYLISGGPTVISLLPTTTTYVMTGLTNGTTYSFQVAATNAHPSSPGPPATANATPSTVPGAPTGLTATSNENAQSTLSWTAPTSNGGLDITGYLVQYGTDSTFATYSTLSSPSSSPKSTVSKLTNGTLYYFRVAAINANPNSPGQYTAGISATPSTVPDAPTNLKATPGNAQVQLSWSSGLSDGGSPITNFKIEYKLSSSAWTGGGQYSMTTPLVIYFLKNGSSYDFRVSAINASGTSQPSDTANATPFLPFTTSCGIKGFVPGPPPWSRAGGNNCPNCVSNYGYAECGADNGLVYSTYALDQRRKAEILKYRSNSAQLSPSQQYSMMSRNAYTRKKSWATQTQTYTNPNVNNLPEIKNASGETVALQCNQPPVLCSMTSDSDVPGPVIPLCIDASVPLYNYKMQVTPASGGNFEPLNSSN